MAFAFVFIPLILAGVALGVSSNRARPWLLPLAATVHLALTALTFRHAGDIGARTTGALTEVGGWLVLDAAGRLVLILISVLFFLCSIYAVGYLKHRNDRDNRVFCACLLVFLGMMSLVVWSHHLGLMWVAIEATTLASAPLIYFNRTPRSIEATWKYLLICSVGIALALLGTFFVAYASLHTGGESSLVFDRLLRTAPLLSRPWLRAGFVLLFVGYGTKMGLAPMHTWKPDAYGEAPGLVGALLAGGLTNCAFLAILRIHHLCHAAGDVAFADRTLIFMGLLSMGIAGVYLIRQRDFKRMLAYSSVEHMGILVLGVGLGGGATFGAMLHLINNGLTKGVLFLSAGNIHRAYASKNTDDVRGALWRLPLSGGLFLTGFLAITGSPPFGPFVSEFTILGEAFKSGRFFVGGAFLFLLLLVFLGMGATVLLIVQGRPREGTRFTSYRDGWSTAAPVVALALLVLLMGVYVPGPIDTLCHNAADYLQTSGAAPSAAAVLAGVRP